MIGWNIVLFWTCWINNNCEYILVHWYLESIEILKGQKRTEASTCSSKMTSSLAFIAANIFQRQQL